MAGAVLNGIPSFNHLVGGLWSSQSGGLVGERNRGGINSAEVPVVMVGELDQ
jgi:hypothetical protein